MLKQQRRWDYGLHTQLHTAHETLQTCQFSVSTSDCEYLTYLITLLHACPLSQLVKSYSMQPPVAV